MGREKQEKASANAETFSFILQSLVYIILEIFIGSDAEEMENKRDGDESDEDVCGGL